VLAVLSTGRWRVNGIEAGQRCKARSTALVSAVTLRKVVHGQPLEGTGCIVPWARCPPSEPMVTC
jgi:hypothetical protein